MTPEARWRWDILNKTVLSLVQCTFAIGVQLERQGVGPHDGSTLNQLTKALRNITEGEHTLYTLSLILSGSEKAQP